MLLLTLLIANKTLTSLVGKISKTRKSAPNVNKDRKVARKHKKLSKGGKMVEKGKRTTKKRPGE